MSAIHIRKGIPLSNRGKPWTDDELRVVLSHAPTRANITRLARAFRRTEGSVQQIYRWAAASEQRIARARPRNRFIHQILRLRKEVGWCAVGDNTANREELRALTAQHQRDQELIQELRRIAQEAIETSQMAINNAERTLALAQGEGV